jgi:hypothetical protein
MSSQKVRFDLVQKVATMGARELITDDAPAEIDLPDCSSDKNEWQSSSAANPALPRSLLSPIVLGTAAMLSALAVTHFCLDDRKVLVIAAVLLVEAIAFAWLGALAAPGGSPAPYFAGTAFFIVTALLAVCRVLSRAPM